MRLLCALWCDGNEVVIEFSMKFEEGKRLSKPAEKRCKMWKIWQSNWINNNLRPDFGLMPLVLRVTMFHTGMDL